MTQIVIRQVDADGWPLLTIDALAREAGLTPRQVRRLIALGALEREGGTALEPRFPRHGAVRLARIVRLRAHFELNDAGALLAADLLARIDDLEERLRTSR